MCFLYICLFILHELMFSVFLFLLESEVAASDCGTPWTFLFTFYDFDLSGRSFMWTRKRTGSRTLRDSRCYWYFL